MRDPPGSPTSISAVIRRRVCEDPKSAVDAGLCNHEVVVVRAGEHVAGDADLGQGSGDRRGQADGVGSALEV